MLVIKLARWNFPNTERLVAASDDTTPVIFPRLTLWSQALHSSSCLQPRSILLIP